MTKKASLTFEEAKALADECRDYTEFRTKYPILTVWCASMLGPMNSFRNERSTIIGR